jgi:hypothetical protein
MCTTWLIKFLACGDAAKKVVRCEQALAGEGCVPCRANEDRTTTRNCCCCRRDCVSETGCTVNLNQRPRELESLEAKIPNWIRNDRGATYDIKWQVLRCIERNHILCVGTLREAFPVTDEPNKDLDFS